jgi:putative ABC transport system permease protein
VLLGLAYSAMGLGIYLSLRIFRIPDITTDGSFTFAGAITAVLLWQYHLPAPAILPVVMMAGALTGMATGHIHTRLDIHPLLAGILVMTGLYSISLTLMGRSNIPMIALPDIFTVLPFEREINQWILITGLTLVAALLLVYLLKTDFGIAMRATGDNEQMAVASGVNTRLMKITGLALANAFTALSGYLVVQYQGFADINMGIGIVISGLAAVIIGESLIRKVKSDSLIWQVGSVIVGSVIFRLALAAALISGIHPNFLKLITALIVLLIVSLTGISRQEK